MSAEDRSLREAGGEKDAVHLPLRHPVSIPRSWRMGSVSEADRTDATKFSYVVHPIPGVALSSFVGIEIPSMKRVLDAKDVVVHPWIS